jgi:integrase/recombinase XerD
MKKLTLQTTSYQHLEKGFSEWLDILGYNSMSVYNVPILIREFLYFLEQQECTHITQLTQKHYQDYYHYISTRANQRRGGGLSNNYLNKQIQALEKFYEYMIHKGVQGVPAVALKHLKLENKEITVLTQSEVKELYQVTEKNTNTLYYQALGARDRAMLSVFYSCGLRRTEGVHVTINDINWDRRILHVRKGKNYKERLVPFSHTSLKYLQEWVYDYRSILLKISKSERLFIGKGGKGLSGNSLYKRIKLLQCSVENIELQQKEIGLHTLRHSIATHLLQNGMDLQKIQRFLGHSSLESTQIYTHLLEKQNEPVILSEVEGYTHLVEKEDGTKL